MCKFLRMLILPESSRSFINNCLCRETLCAWVTRLHFGLAQRVTKNQKWRLIIIIERNLGRLHLFEVFELTHQTSLLVTCFGGSPFIFYFFAQAIYLLNFDYSQSLKASRRQ